ncbi:MAG: hypothetical protein HXY20_12865 [Acidobacteria bacterium]|nr:hypothetical protein [Acidobacteriota bacterium]
MTKILIPTLLITALSAPISPASDDPEASFAPAVGNGKRSEEALRRTRRMLHAWLAYADPHTLLLPDFIPGYTRGKRQFDLYTPHNSGADNYPYLVATAFFTDPALFRGRMMQMLRNEVRYANAGYGIPGNLDLKTRQLGPPSLFGAAEYAKDGLLAITELLGRTPWFYRMADMTATLMERAPVASDFGNLPDSGAELNGDVLQTLVRLATMTGDRRFLEWAERIGDAYVREVLPRNHGLPGYTWDFAEHEGPDRMRLRDHGNEIVVGLVLLHTLENDRGSERAAEYRPAIARMLDRILESANPDGMLYNEVRCSDLKPANERLSDNWGYVYGAVYTFYMSTGEKKYRDAVLRVLKNLPKYRGYDWENGSHDGYADSIESALYLVAREPVPEALQWIESEMETLIRFQRPDGTIERWYGDGNWNRTLLLYALYKTQGCYVQAWQEGVALGAHRDGGRLFLAIDSPRPWSGILHFDHARHRRAINLDRNYVRLNEWPEWFTVGENTLYRLVHTSGKEEVRLGAELIQGIPVKAPVRLMLDLFRQ